MIFDAIVIGAGHAGCEASLAIARLGFNTLLITSSLERIAVMSCNPAIGGVGKGHIVKEIDALGGEMPKIADRTGIHFRTLNLSRGQAVQATRSQNDMNLYHTKMTEQIFATEKLHLCQDSVIEILTKSDNVFGVSTTNSGIILSKAIVVTVGTFLDGQIHIGHQKFAEGRIGEIAVSGLSKSLKSLGFELDRFKTGTCARLDGRTIDYSTMKEQKSESPAPMFSFENKTPFIDQISCYITYTNSVTKDIISDAVNLGHSPLYNGQISGKGPRYCPSIEDKVMRFPYRDSHSIFLEPQNLNTYEIYPNGLSTSLPYDIQLKFLRSIDGFSNVRVTRWGYAVEYDFVKPTQLKSTLESKIVNGLYFAGQINGTTGYEEAAAQGLLAGLNVAMRLKNKDPIILNRKQAYIGVLIDDLVTLGTEEPYRMLTARAEQRLYLREDNAYYRLMDIGFQSGLLALGRYQKMVDFENAVKTSGSSHSDCHVRKRAEIENKYSGYIARLNANSKTYNDLEKYVLPKEIFEHRLPGISNEVFEKLKKHKPENLAQASRLSGITSAAQEIIRIAILKTYHNRKLSYRDKDSEHG